MKQEADRPPEKESLDVAFLPEDEQKLKTMRSKLEELEARYNGVKKQNESEEKLKIRHPEAKLPDRSKRDENQAFREVKLKVLKALFGSGFVNIRELYPENDDRVLLARTVLTVIKDYIDGKTGVLNL